MSPGRPLLGRSRELAELEAALDRAVGGHGSVFLLAGEPGIGKTRLAEEIAESARGRGVATRWGRAWEVEGAPSCWLWSQLLRDSGAELDADLAPLLTPAGAPAKAVDPEHALLREAAAIVALLRRLASEQPLLVIFDDLHAADLASLGLLQLVARDLRGAPILIVGTYREVEARRNPRIAALLAKVGREGSVRPLGRLDRGAVTRWVEEVLGAAPPSLAEAVFGATEGNPLFVEAVVQVLAARGPDAELAPGFALPDTILAAVSELVARVSADAQPLLETAAVFGRDCSLAALEIALERPAEELRAAVTEGIAAGVLCAQPRPSSPVRFAHVLVREAIYQALPTPQRVALHARVARALGRLHAGELDAHLAELAHHAFECAPAVPWLETADLSSRAADRAMELLAFDDAARHFERALIALDHAESPDDLRRAELLRNLGVAEIRLGRGRAGRDHCERSAAVAERAGRPELFARAALAFGVEIVPGRADPRLVELLETALRLGPVSTALRAQLLARLAAALTPTLHSERAAALAREAIATARSLADRGVLAEVLTTARGAFTLAEPLEELLALDHELSTLARGLGARLLAVQAYGRAALIAMALGDAAETTLQLHLMRELTAALRAPHQQMRSASIHLVWASLTGQEEEVVRSERAILDLVDEVDDARGLYVLEANRHQRAQLRGDYAGAHAALDRLDSLLATEGLWAHWRPLWRAGTLAEEGHLDEARAQLLRCAPEGPTAAMTTLGPFVLTRLAGIVVHLGDREWMRVVYDLLLPFAAHISVSYAVPVGDGPVAYHLGRLAAGLGELDQSSMHLHDALARCERAGLSPYAARTRRALETLGVPKVAPARIQAPPRIERDGELWTLSHDGRQIRLKDSKGLQYLAVLLGDPEREVHAGELAGLDVGGLGDAGELLDARARAAYKQRLEGLADRLEDAEERGDAGAVARLRHEREALADELARAVGLGGRDRRASSAAERARINVQRRIRDVLNRIAEIDEPLARYLDRHVKTGIFCSFVP